MAKTKFFKLTSLPQTLVPNAFYFIENGTVAESYVTNGSGVAKAIGNTAMITGLINQAISATNSFEIVSTIAERNSLTLNRNTMVLVTNATGDTSVTSGSALYVWNNANSSWSKVAEYESMDVVINWGNIQGKPNSSPTSIDLAVANSHTHTNKVQLDKIGEDADGDITYNGDAVQKWSQNNW